MGQKPAPVKRRDCREPRGPLIPKE
jgi:hypothetical protein